MQEGSGRPDITRLLREWQDGSAEALDRLLGGLTIEETVVVMGLSSATINREWAVARAWLYRELTGEASSEDDPKPA